MVGVQTGPEVFETAGKHDNVGGNVVTYGRGRQNMLATFEGDEVGGATCKDV
jgi:hypothetical protein